MDHFRRWRKPSWKLSLWQRRGLSPDFQTTSKNYTMQHTCHFISLPFFWPHNQLSNYSCLYSFRVQGKLTDRYVSVKVNQTPNICEYSRFIRPCVVGSAVLKIAANLPSAGIFFHSKFHNTSHPLSFVFPGVFGPFHLHSEGSTVAQRWGHSEGGLVFMSGF